MNGIAGIMTEIVKRANDAVEIKESDYYDPEGLLVCGVCNTPKQCHISLFGEKTVVGCMCECEAAKQREEKAARKIAAQVKQIKLLRSAGFPESDMQRFTFDNDDMSNERITNAVRRYVEHFFEFRRSGKGLLLYGDVGTGKTYAACEAANALVDQGIPVLVTNFSRLLNTLQGTFEKQKYIDGLNGYELLVIDDLGINRNTAFAKEQIYNIIDGRYRAGLPMIITTNLSLEVLKKPSDLEDSRVYDRILERCFPIEVNGKSRRKKAVCEGYENIRKLLEV